MRASFYALPVLSGSFLIIAASPDGFANVEPPIGFHIVADFEGGVPAGFVAFTDARDGSGSSTTLSMATQDGPVPQVPAPTVNAVVSVSYDVASSGSWGGGPGYAGVTHDFAIAEDWRDATAFTCWFHGSNSSADLRVELKSDGANPANANRYQYRFADDEAGWRFLHIPWSAFTRRMDYNPGPSPTDPIRLETIWGYSILLPGGANGSFQLDQVALTTSAVADEFEAGIPSGLVPFADSWDGSGSSTTLAMATQTEPLPRIPGHTGNLVISTTYDIAASGSWGGGPGYGGVVRTFASAEDWRNFETFGFWFRGSNSGSSLRIELQSDGFDPFNSNRYEFSFVDDTAGWRFFNLPWNVFTPRFDFNPGPSPTDPINLEAMWGYAILLPGGAAGNFQLDQASLFRGFAPGVVGIQSIGIVEGKPTLTLCLPPAVDPADTIPIQRCTSLSSNDWATVAWVNPDQTSWVDTTPLSPAQTVFYHLGDFSPASIADRGWVEFDGNGRHNDGDW